MNTAPPRPAARPAAEVVKPLPLSDAAKAHLTPDSSVRQYLDALLAAGLCDDALRVLALGLPKPEAVWWGCLCVREAVPKPWTVAVEKAVEAAEAWVMDPSDTNRRTAGTAAEAAGWDTAGGCVAGAAWLSGGSLSPPKLPPVQPREDLTGQTLAGALMLASTFDPKNAVGVRQRFVQVGMRIAGGQLKKGEVGK
jgi:hypothetical protein